MGSGKSRSEEVRERRQRGLQTLAFVGALVVLGVVLYTAVLSQRNRRVEDRLSATAMAQQRAEATAAPARTAAAQATATAQVFAERRTTPVPAPGEAISVENAGRVRQLARWGKGGILDLAWSPDGQLLAVGGTIGVFLYNPWTHEELRYLETPWPVHCLTFSPDGQTLAVGSFDAGVQLWQVADGTPLHAEMLEGIILEVAFSPGGELLVAGQDLRNGKVWLWWDKRGIVLQAPVEETGGESLLTAAISPRGEFLAFAGEDGRVWLWRVADGVLLRTLDTGAKGSQPSLAFSPDGRVLAAGSARGVVFLWQVEDGALQRTLAGNMWVGQVTFSPDGQFLAFRDSSATWLYRLSDGALRQTWWGSNYLTIAFSPDGLFLALALARYPEGSVGLAQVVDGMLLHTLRGHSPAVGSVAFSPFPAGGQALAARLQDGSTWLWRLADGVPLQVFQRPGYRYGGLGLAFSHDGSMLASGESDGTVSLWRVADGTLAHTLAGATDTSGLFPPGEAASVAFSPGGQTLAAALADSRIVVWQIADGTILQVLGQITSTWPVWSQVAFSPDGQVLAASTVSHTVSFWRVSDGRLLRTLEGHTDQVMGVAFSPDGQVLSSASYDGTLRLWQVADGVLLRTLNQGKAQGKEAPTAVAFSPDGQILACGTAGGSVWLWQVADGIRLKVLEGHKGWVMSLAFSPDGRLLASAAGDGTIRFWGVTP